MKTDNLIPFSVPAFVLAGMAFFEGKRSAPVKSHDGKEVILEVGGGTVGVTLKSEDTYAPGTRLVFGDDGAVVGYEDTGKDVIIKPAATTEVPVAQSTRRSGSNERAARSLHE